MATPSDLLAAVAWAIIETEVAHPDLARLEGWITNELLLDYRSESHWLKSLAELREDPILVRLPDPIAPAGSVGGLANLVRAAQMLDIWHLPLSPGARMEKSEAHIEAEDRLHDFGRYNSSPDLGLLLPALAANGPGPANEAFWHDPLTPMSTHPPGALWPWLESTTFLPRSIPGQGPDCMGEAGGADRRDIDIIYRRTAPLSATHPYISPTPKIAVAPLVQTGTDVHLIHTSDGAHYNLVPFYSDERLREALSRAIDEKADLLLIPEMAVCEDRLTVLQDLIPQAARDYRARTGMISSLAYVLAGITSARPGAVGRNFLVMLNAMGEEVFRQDKLSHWNIDSWQQQIFGLDDLRCGLADPVMEHTAAGTVLHIREIDGLGRIVNCICSDLDQNLPLDWLILNARLDLLHAAIMDKSLCWGKSPTSPPWPVRRAERAATELRGKLVVTNSIGLTEWASATNVRRKNKYGAYEAAAIALCLDARSGALKQKLIFADLGQKDTIVKCESWTPAAWVRFPSPAFG